MTIHGAIADKKTALIIMRLHNSKNTDNRCFLIKDQISICYSYEKKEGFLIVTKK